MDSATTVSPAPIEDPSPRIEHFRREAVLVLDEQGRVVEWNLAAELIFGFERAEVIGRRVPELILPPEDIGTHARRFASLALPDSPFRDRDYVAQVLRADGRRISVSVRVTPTGTEPVNYIVLVRDLSGNEPTELWHRRLEAMLDSSDDAMALIGTNGRIISWNQGAECLYGFTTEEARGRLFASILVPGERMNEPLEWLPLLQQGQTVERETERLRKTGEKIWVSVRMTPLRDADGKVDAIIWIAKDVSDGHRLQERDRIDEDARRWGRRARRALTNGGLLFAAQPIVDLAGERLDHHELLLRMRTESGEIATPDRFLPFAERTGLIGEIDLWVVEHGIEIAASHPVAINLSGASITRSAICERIEERLEETGTDPSRITFELTETAAAEDIDRASELVKRLATLGCRIALDDFGTGFGTFTYLNKLPVTELKIDREFVAGMGDSDSDRRVVETMVTVAGKFGMRTVAEGIEDEGTRRILEDMGVDLGQGYLFSKPRLIEELWGEEGRDGRAQRQAGRG